MTVISLDARRRTASTDDLLICDCGSTWFELRDRRGGEDRAGAVVINHEGRVTGYSGITHCVECGQAKLP